MKDLAVESDDLSVFKSPLRMLVRFFLLSAESRQLEREARRGPGGDQAVQEPGC